MTDPTPTLDAVTAAAKAFAESEHTRGSLEQYEADQSSIDALNAQIAELQAKIAATIETIPIPDFPTGNAGLLLPSLVTGKGPGLTNYEMAPMLSTHGNVVPAQSAGGTNPLTMLVAGGNDASHSVWGLSLSGFTLHGTPQGHLYNGLRVGWSMGAVLSDIVVKGIPGNSSANPGETFSVNLWHANNASLTNVRVDGTDDSGTRVAASGFGLNNLDGATLTKCVSHGTKYGNGITTYKCSNVTYVDCDFSGCHKPMNFEQCSGGTFHVIRPDLRGADKLPHITINGNIGSSKIMIEDPLVDSWPLRVGVEVKTPTYSALYLGKPQTQLVSDVQLIRVGVDVSSDPKYLAVGNVW